MIKKINPALRNLSAVSILTVMVGAGLFAQDTIQQSLRVMNIPYLIAGSFGEPRSTHFHYGIDIKTQGITGIPVFSAGHGHVVRIRTEPSGYGRSVYIEQDDGFTAVYGHLSGFSPELEAYVLHEQYRRERFNVDLYPAKGRFRLAKGALLGYSGNTGSSQGPHLHFELRDTRSGNPVNPAPMLGIVDRTPPVLNRVWLYNHAESFKNWDPLHWDLVKSGGQYQVSGDPILPLSSLTGFGIELYDLIDGSANHCGIVGLTFFLDEELVFSVHIDELPFHESRNVYSFMDYVQFQKYNRPVIRLFQEPNNRSGLYNYTCNRGYLPFDDGEIHSIRIEATDAGNNRSVLRFKARLNPSAFREAPVAPAAEYHYVAYASEYQRKDSLCSLVIPANALFSDLNFSYNISQPFGGIMGIVHHFHRDDTGLQKPIKLGMNLAPVSEKLKNKALIVRIDQGNRLVSAGGSADSGWLYTEISRFGKYALAIDTLPPIIQPVNFSHTSEIGRLDRIQFRIFDNLSGIQEYRAEVDGQWLLMEYDPKNRMLTGYLKRDLKPGEAERRLMLRVSDTRGNISTFQASFRK